MTVAGRTFPRLWQIALRRARPGRILPHQRCMPGHGFPGRRHAMNGSGSSSGDAMAAWALYGLLALLLVTL